MLSELVTATICHWCPCKWHIISFAIFVVSFTLNTPEIPVLSMYSCELLLFIKQILKQLPLIFKIDFVSLLMTSFVYKLKRLLLFDFHWCNCSPITCVWFIFKSNFPPIFVMLGIEPKLIRQAFYQWAILLSFSFNLKINLKVISKVLFVYF